MKNLSAVSQMYCFSTHENHACRLQMKGDIPQTVKEYIVFMLPDLTSGCVAFTRKGVPY
jgi:hypothetical protein